MVQTHNPVLADVQLMNLCMEAVQSVFSVMLDLKTTFMNQIEQSTSYNSVAQLLKTQEDVIAVSVGIRGNPSGALYLYCTDKTGNNFASRLMGNWEPEKETLELSLIVDSMGEVMNMIVGNFKNKLCDLGLSCELTTPTFVHGFRFFIEIPPDVKLRRKFIRFNTECGEFIIDMQLKTNQFSN